MSDRELKDAHAWFIFVTRGLYRHEFGRPLRSAHAIYLLRPGNRPQFEVLRNLILNDSGHAYRSYADGEFQYIFASNDVDELTAWLYAFKAITVAAVMLGPSAPTSLQSSVEEEAWKPPT